MVAESTFALILRGIFVPLVAMDGLDALTHHVGVPHAADVVWQRGERAEKLEALVDVVGRAGMACVTCPVGKSWPWWDNGSAQMARQCSQRRAVFLELLPGLAKPYLHP